MRMGLGFLPRKIVLRGDVFTIRLYATARPDRELDDRLYEFMLQLRPEYEDEVRRVVGEHLGKEFEVRSVDFIPGSAEVLMVIRTAYYAVANYDSFIKSVELLASHLRGLLARILRGFGPRPVTVSGNWVSGPALVRAEQAVHRWETFDPSSLLLLYLILSHAGLIAVLVWILVARLK